MQSHRLIGVTWAILQFLLNNFSGGFCDDDDNDEKTGETAMKCREKNRLVTSDNGDIYALVDVSYGEKLALQCHYW